VEKRLIAALSVSLGAALLVIAFLVGRMTRTASGPTLQSPVVIAQREPTPLPVQPAEQPGLTVPDIHPPLPPEATSVREPQTPAHEPQVQSETRPAPHEPGAKSAIVSYFEKMDAIHVEGSGDPALSEAAAEMAKIREAIKTSDVNAITAIAPQLQTTQKKLNDLDQMKKQLLGQ
jgi:hypothetical protein